MKRKTKAWTMILGLTWALATPTFADEPILGQPADWTLEQPEATLLSLQAGSELRAEPNIEAPLLQVLPEVQLALIEWRGSWARVTYGQQTGWIDVDQDPTSAPLPEIEEGREVALRVDPERLRLALKHLGHQRQKKRIGSWTLHTDVNKPKLLEQLDQLASQLEKHFIDRFGLVPIPSKDRGLVVLYSGEEAYRAFSRELGEDWADRRSSAHAVPGLAIFHVELPSEADLLAIVVHELTHLLTWQAFGKLLPWWLEEGLAEDLALSRLEDGHLKPTPLRRANLRYGETLGVVIDELNRVLKRGDLTPMSELLTVSSPEVSTPDELSLLYAQVGLWVRFLLHQPRSEIAEGFHAFLVSVATGKEATQENFLEHLGISLEPLMSNFDQWLRRNEKAFATPHLILRRKRPAGLWLEGGSHQQEQHR